MKKTLIICFSLFMAMAFSGTASAAPVITFDLPDEPILPGSTFDVTMSIDSQDGTLMITQFGAWIDFDDNYLRFVSGNAVAPLTTGYIAIEPVSGWYTKAGWETVIPGEPYYAPEYFEEGPDLIQVNLLGFPSPGLGEIIDLFTLTFECMGSGDSEIHALNRPNAPFIAGNIVDEDIDWLNSVDTVSQVPIPASVLLFGSGLLGLLGIQRRRRK